MSKHKLAYTIQKELFFLNERIDEKIVKGKCYIKEAGRHKSLLRQLHHLGRDSRRRSIFTLFSFR